MMNKTDRIAKLKKMIAELPAGSISRKTINGKVYFYHQWQENGKTQGYSVSEEEAAEIKIQIERRRDLQKELRALEKKSNVTHRTYKATRFPSLLLRCLLVGMVRLQYLKFVL